MEEFFHKLCVIWSQLDSMVPPDSSEKSRLYREEEHIFEFVICLHPKFEITWPQILNPETPCTLEVAVKVIWLRNMPALALLSALSIDPRRN